MGNVIPAIESLVDLLREEVNHARANGHILDRDCQGVGPGQKVPAVRIENIEAILERLA